MRKSVKLFIILFLLMAGCYSARISRTVLEYIEMEDNNLCIMEGVEYKKPIDRDVYWRCRLRIMNQRIDREFNNHSYSALYKAEFKKLRDIIKNRIKQEQDNVLEFIIKLIDEQEHNYCIILKNQTSIQETSLYDYVQCRRDLKLLRNRKNLSYQLNNEDVIDMFYSDEYLEYEPEKEQAYIDKELEIIVKECVPYADHTEKLRECRDAISKILECENNIMQDLLDRRRDDKIYCLKSSINQYPDVLAKFDDESNTASFLGPKMNKIDILELRQKAFDTCYKGRATKIADYKSYLENECRKKNLEIINKKLDY